MKKGAIIILTLLLSVLIMISLTSCGGSGGGGGTGAPSVNPFAGTYSANYTRSPITGSLTIAVSMDGNANVVITDSAAGVFVGNGTVSENGQMTATATQQGTLLSVDVLGQFLKQNDIVTASGSITGIISVPSWTASKISEAGVNAFTGKWSGTYTGSEFGTWAAVLSSDGSITATAQSPSCGEVNLSGEVSTAGLGSLQGRGTGVCKDYTITWEGTFYMENNIAVGAGTWVSSSGFNGQWYGKWVL